MVRLSEITIDPLRRLAEKLRNEKAEQAVREFESFQRETNNFHTDPTSLYVINDIFDIIDELNNTRNELIREFDEQDQCIRAIDLLLSYFEIQ